VFCFRPFKLASEFIRHAEENHRNETGRKAGYMQETYNELARRANSELSLAKTVYLSAHAQPVSKKRTWEAANIGPRISGGKRVMGFNRMPMNSSQRINSTSYVLPPSPLSPLSPTATFV